MLQNRSSIDRPVGGISPSAVASGPVCVPRAIASAASQPSPAITLTSSTWASGNAVNQPCAFARAPSLPRNVSPAAISTSSKSSAASSSTRSRSFALNASNNSLETVFPMAPPLRPTAAPGPPILLPRARSESATRREPSKGRCRGARRRRRRARPRRPRASRPAHRRRRGRPRLRPRDRCRSDRGRCRRWRSRRYAVSIPREGVRRNTRGYWSARVRAASIHAPAAARSLASLDFTTTSTMGPPRWKLGYDPTSTSGHRSPASASTAAISLSRASYVRRHDPMGRSRRSSSASVSNIASISAGSPGRTNTFSIANPGAPPSGFASGRLPAGRSAQRAAYSGSEAKRARSSSASSGTGSCGTPNAAATASRVRSSGVPPRPPVTTTTSAPSACSRRNGATRSTASGTAAMSSTRRPSCSSRRASHVAFVFATSPETSSLPIVRIAAVGMSRIYPRRVPAEPQRLRMPDPARELDAVRLFGELWKRRPPSEFTRNGEGWELELIPPREVERVEYLLELVRGGRTELVPDPTNPLRAGGPFGDRSVLELPGYRLPDWVEDDEAPAAELRTMRIRSRRLRTVVRGLLWASPESDPAEPLPLLVVHDGPEYARYSGLIRLLESAAAELELPPMRAALLAPPSPRDEHYSASARYALALLHAHRVHPGAFGGLVLQSGSYFRLRSDRQESGFPRFQRIARFVGNVLRADAWPDPIPVAMTCGAAEENLVNNRAVREALARQGYPAELDEHPDAHNWVSWRDSLHGPLVSLLQRLWS